MCLRVRVCVCLFQYQSVCYVCRIGCDSLSNTSYTESQQTSDTEQWADDTEHAASSLEYSSPGSEIQGRLLKSNQFDFTTHIVFDLLL